MQKRIWILLIVTTVFLVGCRSIPGYRQEILQFSVAETSPGSLFVFDIGETELAKAGYGIGDWVMLKTGGLAIQAKLAKQPQYDYTTLVVGQHQSTLHVPLAIRQGSETILVPYHPEQKQEAAAVELSGSFTFTF